MIKMLKPSNVKKYIQPVKRNPNETNLNGEVRLTISFNSKISQLIDTLHLHGSLDHYTWQQHWHFVNGACWDKKDAEGDFCFLALIYASA